MKLFERVIFYLKSTYDTLLSLELIGISCNREICLMVLGLSFDLASNSIIKCQIYLLKKKFKAYL